jgi:hypothetical protein
LTVIHAKEREILIDREPTHWKLMTNLPVHSLDEAVEKLKWYASMETRDIPQDLEIRMHGGRIPS